MTLPVTDQIILQSVSIAAALKGRCPTPLERQS